MRTRTIKLKPSEKDEQMALAAWLEAMNICYCHIPNQRLVNHLPNKGARISYMRSLYRQGFQKGFPDLLIFDPPPAASYRGVAIELKVDGGSTTLEQRVWLDSLEARGWLTSVKYGADEAIRWLKDELGYGKR